ncbi:MAG: M20/M25/M40 family metallo-hydrolase [Chitinophagales bacterium]|nr:M20/M25/M40 family metallo-hydrolase [Chitinophagales bacterium]
MKKILLVLLVALIALVAVLLVKTSAYKSRQIVAADGKRKDLPIDESAVKHLSDAIKIVTISNDDTAVVNQAAFDSFFVFLKTEYAPVFEALEDTVINQRSLLLKWKGKNESVKPVILYAHLDVVPIEESTKDKWTHQPFSGEVVDGIIWGRGALDDKGSLISVFEALKKLQAKGFVPERTVYFAFGSDEEIGGNQGAAVIAAHLKAQNVNFEFYIDEGGMVSEGIVPNLKRPVALIGTAEKGYVTLELSVNVKGGHSSQPPKESAIDILTTAIKNLHDNQEGRRTTETVNEFLAYLGPEMSSPLNIVFANQWLFGPVILNEYEKTASGRALLRTTEVATVINAGNKENVIPNLATAKINYRVLNDETTAQVIERAKKLINDTIVKITPGELTEPSRNSSSATYGFKLLQQTSAQVFPDALVTPFLMLGSTDSKHFQDITENTYRFFPTRMNSDLLGTIHGINERIGVKEYMETISFYETLLTNLK